MFRKSDILPLILAFATSAVIVTLGFSGLAKTKIGGFVLEKDSDRLPENNSALQNARSTTAPIAKSNPTASKPISNDRFDVPVIVPQGTSVTINGSAKLNLINQALRRGFHRRYPGTVITTKGDGSTVGLDLLYARKIDLAALDRPLNQAEKAAGLTEIAIYKSQSDNSNGNSQMYYVYREPLSPDTEIFLGYILSEQGQQSLNRL